MAVTKISVVTVCLNVRDTIRLTLESVARQSFPHIEHVIIDGVSTDGTLEIIREYPTVYLSSEKDNGVYDAMDKGSKAVTGDVVIFLNAGDTFYDDEVCDRVADFFDESGADIVFGDLLPVYLKTNDTHDHAAFTSGQVLDLSYVVNRRFLYNESIHHQATFYRRWVVKKCSYACVQPEATGEYNLLLKAVMKQGATVKHIPTPISRFALGGISTGNFNKEWARYVKARDVLRALYYPNFDAVRVKDEMEFRHAPIARPLTRIERRTALKQRIKGVFLFKIYDRLARGMTARVVNALAAELQTAQIANELQLHQLLKGVEANFRAHLAETKGDLEKVQKELEAIRAQRKPDLSGIEAAVDRRLDALTTTMTLTPIQDALERVRDTITALDQRSARDIGAIIETVARVPIAATEIQVWVRAAVESLNQVHVALANDTARGQALNAVMRQALDNIAADLTAFAATLVRVHDKTDLSAKHISGGIDQVIDRLEIQTTTLHETGSRLSYDIQSTSNAVLRNAVLSEQGGARLNDVLMGLRGDLGQMRLEGRQKATFEQSGVKVFSQWDEDGLIEYIVSRCDIPNRTFVEIGVGDYTEANTRFLLTERGWSGLVVDAITADIEKLRASELYWRYPLTALNTYVDVENVNALLTEGGFAGDIGLLSIDVDGVDYWIWNAVEAVRPRIVICEYNGIFGAKAKVTVPYEPNFDRREKHYSWLYSGASLGALADLAGQKGYTLVGCNAGGNNAFFVRNDVLAGSDLTVSGAPYRKPTFRESRNPDGTLSFLDPTDGIGLIANLAVYDVAQGKTIKVSDIDLAYG